MRLLLNLVCVVFFSVSVQAQETVWQDHQEVVETRIIVSSILKDGKRLLGWEAKLAPDWKTYWRSPGEAGLPVRVFSGNDEIELLYPFPERFELFGLETYGYSKHVILPFYVDDAALKNGEMKADFMVCRDICIPFNASYSLADVNTKPASSYHDIRIEAWLEQVPLRDEAPNGLEIVGLKVTGPKGWQKLVVDVKADVDLSDADLLVEAGDSFHFGKPSIQLFGDGTEARIVAGAMSARGAPDLSSQTIRLTLSDGHGSAIDRTITHEFTK